MFCESVFVGDVDCCQFSVGKLCQIIRICFVIFLGNVVEYLE